MDQSLPICYLCAEAFRSRDSANVSWGTPDGFSTALLWANISAVRMIRAAPYDGIRKKVNDKVLNKMNLWFHVVETAA